MFPTSSTLLELVSTPFKRSQLGLFHGKTKLSGNNVPFSKKKTRRTWLPNIQNRRLFSEALDKKIELKVTMRALKTIEKYGGLDNYVLKTKSDILGPKGMELRMKVRDALEKKAAEAATQSKPAVQSKQLLH